MPVQASAQGLALEALAGGGEQAPEQASSEELQRSLDTLIQTLESDQSRQELLDSLRSLRDAGQAAAETGTGSQGLLGGACRHLHRAWRARPRAPVRPWPSGAPSWRRAGAISMA